MTSKNEPPRPAGTERGAKEKCATADRGNYSAARAYAQRGWRVFPAKRDKKPLIDEWPHKATADEDQIRDWWTQWPRANVAVATGRASNLVVLDVDVKEGVDGWESIRELESQHGPLPATPHVQTPRGGGHFYFRCDAHIVQNSAGKLAPGLDIRGDGGYVVAPPSVREDGKDWVWEAEHHPDDIHPAPIPGWLLDKLQATDRASRNGDYRETHEKICAGGRNDALTREAGRLRRLGYDRAIIEAALFALNRERCEPPLPDGEVATIAESVGRYPNSEEQKRRSSEQSPEPLTNGSFCIEDGRICRIKQTKEGPITEPLCNFVARVTEEIVMDDGAETTRAFMLEGALENGHRLPHVRVPAARFAGMNWVTEQWGLRAVVRAGQSSRDYLREAIQKLSPDATARRIFQHTGWRELDGEHVYLMSNGAIGRDGLEVDLGTELSRYQLPRVSEDPVGAMRESLRVLRVAPLTVTVPLWAGMFRAPLASAYPLDVALWVEGRTGSLKSTLTAIALSHFGDFHRTTLPGAWSSTANQLERRAFLLKDAPFVIDDYAPGHLDTRELETKAARLLRAQGNLAGRSRLKSDLSERPAYPPRGLIVATGEQHPPGQSILARTLLIDLERDAVDIALLDKLQATTSRLPHALSGYIAWLAPEMGKLPALLKQTFEGARARATADKEHLRVPEALAHFWIGLSVGLDYASDIGACSPTEADSLRAECWDALLELGRLQGLAVDAERPTLRFLRILLTLMTQGRTCLLRRDEPTRECGPGRDLLGWQDSDYLYLLPDATYQAVARFCRDQGEPFPLRLDRLKRDLSKDGATVCDPGRLTDTSFVGGRTRRILKLDRTTIERLTGETVPDLTDLTGLTGI